MEWERERRRVLPGTFWGKRERKGTGNGGGRNQTTAPAFFANTSSAFRAAQM